MKKDDPDLLLKVIALILGFLWWVWVIQLITTLNALDELTEPYRVNLAMISQNTLIGTVNPVFIRPIVYASLIDCLEFRESSCNPYARGLAGEKGCLQFMPTTWELYCIKKYNIAETKEEIWDCGLQKKCADLMIGDGLISHWTTAHYCDTIE